MGWTFVYLMLFLKLPILGLLTLVWWAIRQEPQPASSGDEPGGSKYRPPSPRHPRRPLSRPPRRGPHGDPAPPAPVRNRPVVARARRVEH